MVARPVEFAGIVLGTARTDEIVGAEEAVAGGVEVAGAGGVVAGVVRIAGVVGIAGIVDITEAGGVVGVGVMVARAIENAGEEAAGIVEIFGAEEIFAGARERLTGVGSGDRFAEAIEEGSLVGAGGRGGDGTLGVPREFLGKKGFAHGLSRCERG